MTMQDEGTGHPRVRQRGSFLIELPPAEAFKLFTAEGERLWVPDWSPSILGSLPQAPGLVFLTGAGADHTIWTVLDCDPGAGRVRYSRVTPGSRAGTVEVTVANTEGGSRVEVVYDLTAIANGGEAALEAYSAPNFAKMMDEWRTLIAAWLATDDARGILMEAVV